MRERVASPPRHRRHCQPKMAFLNARGTTTESLGPSKQRWPTQTTDLGEGAHYCGGDASSQRVVRFRSAVLRRHPGSANFATPRCSSAPPSPKVRSRLATGTTVEICPPSGSVARVAGRDRDVVGGGRCCGGAFRSERSPKGGSERRTERPEPQDAAAGASPSQHCPPPALPRSPFKSARRDRRLRASAKQRCPTKTVVRRARASRRHGVEPRRLWPAACRSHRSTP
jgi:hypothetical protein